jgi:hypothetical protein
MLRRSRLAQFATELASTPLVGDANFCGPDLEPVLAHFPRDDMSVGFEWCAAFVFHCCYHVGIILPMRYPDSRVSCRFAGVKAWLDWSQLPETGFFHAAGEQSFRTARGDIVVFDQLVSAGFHDHIGIVLAATGDTLVAAEGNVENKSGIFRRSRSHNLNGYIRIPEAYHYKLLQPPVPSTPGI